MARPLHARLSVTEGRRFGLATGAAFLVLGAAARWRGHETIAMVFAGLGLLLITGGLAIPGRLVGVRERWMRGAELLSRVTTPLVLGAIYFVVITPIGVLMRVLRRDPLAAPPSGSTVWTERAPEHRRSDLRRQF